MSQPIQQKTPRPVTHGRIRFLAEGATQDDLEAFEDLLEAIGRLRHAGDVRESQRFEGQFVQRFEVELPRRKS